MITVLFKEEYGKFSNPQRFEEIKKWWQARDGQIADVGSRISTQSLNTAGQIEITGKPNIVDKAVPISNVTFEGNTVSWEENGNRVFREVDGIALDKHSCAVYIMYPSPEKQSEEYHFYYSQ